MTYKGNGIKTGEKVYKRLYTKLPLNRVVPAGQFTSTSERDVNHPTLGHKTKFQWEGSGVLVTRTCPPVPSTNTTLVTSLMMNDDNDDKLVKLMFVRSYTVECLLTMRSVERLHFKLTAY